MKQNFFLATTALEDFWDTSKPILFLGEWCVLYEREKYLEDIDWRILNSPFQDANVTEAASFYVDDLYEHILAELANKLNVIHEKRYSLRYWRILIGPWLLHYIPAVYDRFKHIKSALEEDDNLTTIVLSEKSFVVAEDKLDFTEQLSDDLFNLQIYTRIFKFFGKKFPEKECSIRGSFSKNIQPERSLFKNVITRLSGFYVSMYSAFSRSFVVLTATSFSKSSQANIAARSFGRVVPIQRCQPSVMTSEYDRQKRNVLKSVSLGSNEFLRCLEAMLSSDIPKAFIEDFEAINETALISYPKRPAAILSANAWFYDESFKFWVGDCAEHDCQLLGTQHGGDYGVKKFMLAEKHELNIVDHYYSWGWSWGSDKLIPMPADKFIKNNRTDNKNVKKGILFVISSQPRYLVKLPYLPKLFREYMDWHKKFIDGLCTESRRHLKIRPHRDDYGWSVIKRLRDHETTIKLSSWDTSFDIELNKCRIYVCDHLSTTYVQAMIQNVPTILFWSSRNNILKEEAKPYFDLLRDVGILYSSPKDASAAISCIYDDAEVWWKDPKRQNAVAEFCKVFARTEPKSEELWTAELLKRCLVE